jgi:phage shock protein C
MTEQPVSPRPEPGAKRLTRSRDDVWLSGVCAGIGEYAGIDPNLVRLLTVVGALFSFGTLFVAYVVAWILMPQH